MIDRVVDGLFALLRGVRRRLGGRSHHPARRPLRGRRAGGPRARRGERGGVPERRRRSTPPTTRWPRPTARSAPTGPSGCGRTTTRRPPISRSRGHVLDAQPDRHGARPRRASSGRRPMRCPSGPPRATWRVVGPLNDRAYPFGTDSFTRALRNLPGDGDTRVRGERRRRAGGMPPDDRPRRQLGRGVRRGRARGARTRHLGAAARARAGRRGRARHPDLHARLDGARLSGLRAGRLPQLRASCRCGSADSGA